MEERITVIANLLLRLGTLDPDDADHQALFEELMGNPVLWDGVKERLGAVGFDLVQFFGRLGVRLQRRMELWQDVRPRGTLGMHAGHIRLLVWLWTQLVYRQIKSQIRSEDVEPVPGKRQGLLDFGEPVAEEDVITVPVEEAAAEFSEEYSQSAFKGMLTTLKRHDFVRQVGPSGPLLAGPALYVLVDPWKMEDFVVGLARRGAATLPPTEEDA